MDSPIPVEIRCGIKAMTEFQKFLPSRRFLAILLGLGILAELAWLKTVSGQVLQGSPFLKMNYCSPPAGSDSEYSGKILLSFSGKIQGKIRQEVGLPLLYLDILGATIDISPLVTPFSSGPIRLVRLAQISRSPPVVRATIFLRSLPAHRLEATENAIEITFEKPNFSDKAQEKPRQSLIPPETRQTGTTASNIFLDLKNADSGNLLQELAKQAGMNLHFRDPVQGTLNITATAANALEAMNLISEKLGFQLSVEDGEIWISNKNNPLLMFPDSDFVQGADLRGLALADVLRALGQLGRLNILIDSSLETIKDKPVDLLLQKMPYRQVFETLLKLNDLVIKAVDSKTLLVMTRKEALRSQESFIRVVPLQTDIKKTLELIKSTLPLADLEQITIKEDQGNLIVVGEKELVNRAVMCAEAVENKLKKAGEGVTREYYQVVNTKPDDLIKLVEETLGEASKPKITKVDRTDTLIISGSQETVDRSKQLIQKLDKPCTPQALIHIKLVEMKREDLKTFGIRLTTNNISVADVGNVSGTFPLPAALSFLESKNRVKTLANPTLRCMDKEESTINVSEQIPVKSLVTDYLPVASTSLAARSAEQWSTTEIGMKLSLKPTIHKNREISMDLNVDFTELVQMVEGHPWTAKRNLKTKVRVKDMETVVIGGLIRRRDTNYHVPLPIVSRIPFLKRLFKPIEHKQQDKEDTEMVMLITPKIVTPAAQAELEKSREESSIERSPQKSLKKSNSS